MRFYKQREGDTRGLVIMVTLLPRIIYEHVVESCIIFYNLGGVHMSRHKTVFRLLVICLALLFIITDVPVLSLAAEDGMHELCKVYCTATVEDSFSVGEVLIVLMPEYNENVYTTEDFTDINCRELEELSIEVESGTLGRIMRLSISGDSKQNVIDAIRILEQRNDIYSAEPNYILELNVEPDDPGYVDGYQWGIDKIDMPAAWNYRTEAYSVYVGVMDTGIDWTHEDLYNVNAALSRNFVDDSSPLNDEHGHGTMVASVIGADGDNDIGITGVCWGVNLVSLKVATDYGHLDIGAAVAAVEYADSAGIQILNLSLGTYTGHITSLQVAIQNYDGLFVCSAGNYGWNTDTYANRHYPSAYNYLTNVISVGASNSSDQRWVMDSTRASNYGKTTVDIFAPGENIYCCYPGNRYVYASGTSVAAPFVAGVAALIMAKYPATEISEVKNQILYDSDIISGLSDYCVSGGRLNAYRAIAPNT